MMCCPVTCWDHPRGCGEHRRIAKSHPVQIGSSPRMRGALLCSRHQNWVWRIIPADAGSTEQLRCGFELGADHPRGCGEHWIMSSALLADPGSSPRMRGALNVHPVLISQPRIIPADAGSTWPRRAPCRTGADHPRGCGEHHVQRSHQHRFQGSSPRMRGAPADRTVRDGPDRIIPADAGSTPEAAGSPTTAWDHPRGCGEHTAVSVPVRLRTGSSPRMRGALLAPCRHADAGGIIPADAGSTGEHGHVLVPVGDHPRGCGEHPAVLKSHAQAQGSSPRMRGALSGVYLEGVQLRIIPADAGSTPALQPLERDHQDHPRGCGEHYSLSLASSSAAGSSPRMRGAPTAGTRKDRRRRIIPADAGSTDAKPL